MARRVAITGITFSLIFQMSTISNVDDVVSRLSRSESSSDWRENYHFTRNGTTKSPCDNAAGAASLVVRRVE